MTKTVEMSAVVRPTRRLSKPDPRLLWCEPQPPQDDFYYNSGDSVAWGDQVALTVKQMVDTVRK